MKPIQNTNTERTLEGLREVLIEHVGHLDKQMEHMQKGTQANQKRIERSESQAALKENTQHAKRFSLELQNLQEEKRKIAEKFIPFLILKMSKSHLKRNSSTPWQHLTLL